MPHVSGGTSGAVPVSAVCAFAHPPSVFIQSPAPRLEVPEMTASPEGGFQTISRANLLWLSALLSGKKTAEGALIVFNV